MRSLVVFTVVASLLMAVRALYLIYRLEQYLDSPSWNRKRWGWILMAGCLAVGVYHGVTIERDLGWLDLLFVATLLLSLVGFTDSYRLLLKDLKRLPVKWK